MADFPNTLDVPAGIVRVLRKDLTFTGAAGAGAVGQMTALTKTGQVYVYNLKFFCKTSLVGAGATISCGIATSVAALIAATVAANILVNDFWVSNAPTLGLIAEPVGLSYFMLNTNITFDILVNAVTAGMLAVECEYVPLSPDGALA